MSNELNAVASLNFDKNGAAMEVANQTATDITGTLYADVIRLVPTSSTVITFGNITAVGWFMVQNLDNTNYVDIGFDGTTWPIRLKADQNGGNTGGFVFAQGNSCTVYAKANTASCEVSARAVDL